MRRIAVLVALAVLAVLAVAVMTRRRRSRAATPLATTPRRPVATIPPAESRFVSVPWTLAVAPQDEPQLAIRCHQDDRLVLDRVDVQETPTQVFVTALGRRQPRNDSEPARGEADATVPLSRPLAKRELIHTPVDPYP